MAARGRHRDLRLEFADETQLHGGSDPSPGFSTRAASPGQHLNPAAGPCDASGEA
jgi:hypothetical protein